MEWTIRRLQGKLEGIPLHASSGMPPQASSGKTLHASSGKTLHASSGKPLHASSGKPPHASSGKPTQAGSGMGLLLLMAYGSLILRMEPDGTELELKRGDVAYAPPGSRPTLHAGSGRMQELFVLGLEAGSPSMRELRLPEEGASLRTQRLDWMMGRLRTLLEEDSDREPGYRVRGEGIALEIAALWSREARAGQPAPVAARHLERMKAYIQDKYREKITKEDLGRCIGRTPNYAATLFRRGTGQTISEYVHAQRMRTAVYMLSESLLTIEEIADYLGYGEVSYFQRVFRRAHGAPPSRYVSRTD